MAVPVKDSGPMESKKFLALVWASTTSKFLLGCGLYVLRGHVDAAGLGLWWWMITLTICVSFLEVGGILGIAYVDRFVRVAQITANQNPFQPGGSPAKPSDSAEPPHS